MALALHPLSSFSAFRHGSVPLESHFPSPRSALFPNSGLLAPNFLFSFGCYRAHKASRRFRTMEISAQFDVMEKGRAVRLDNVAPALAASLATSSALPEVAPGHSDTFQKVTTEKELLSGIWKEVEAKRIPQRAGHGMQDLYLNYREAGLEGGTPQEEIVQIMATVLDRILLQFEDPFTFPSYHKAIREPYDYYKFGQNYIGPLVNRRNSFLGNLAWFNEAEEQLKQGDNVVLFANHQSEADPAVMAILLERTNSYLAQKLTYIAGDRVVLDPFCKPFSMGRNLLCVYSKKHITDEPALTDMKRKANARALKELALLLRKGGQLIWIAPSGGRDRPDSVTKKWSPAMFDAAPVDNIRRLIEHSKAPGHMYPLALLCYNIMPPPPEVQKEIGEKRLLGFSGVGMSIGSELDVKEIISDCQSPEEESQIFTQTVWERVKRQYAVLSHAVDDKAGLAASTSSTVLSHPWTENSSISNGKEETQ